jgi:hypothetical protein
VLLDPAGKRGGHEGNECQTDQDGGSAWFIEEYSAEYQRETNSAAERLDDTKKVHPAAWGRDKA